VVVIDRQYRILTINAAARRLLGIRDLGHDQDFLHTVRGMPYQEVRRVIDTCFRERSTIQLQESELVESSEGSGKYVSLTVMAMQIEQGTPELAVITVTDVTEHVQIKPQLEGRATRSR
jgi:PAS domain S-box-containing protein